MTLPGWRSMLAALEVSSDEPDPDFLDWLSAEAAFGRIMDVALRRHWIGKEAGKSDELVEEVLHAVGLEHTRNMYPSELSGGMKRRIGLARTLILKPEIVLYDEPTTGLDPITGKEIVELILELQRTYNTSSIIISHDLNVAKLAANRIALLHEGRNHVEGSYQEFLNSEDPVVKRFFIFM